MITKLLPFLALAGAIGLFFGYIDPTYTGTIETLQSALAQDDSALAAAAQFDTQEQALTQKRDAIPQDELARLNTFLPAGVNNVQLILDLTSLASRSGLQLSNFGIGTNSAATSNNNGALQVAPSSSLDSLDLSVSATGTYQAFRTFLAGMESSLRPLDVMSIDVKDSPTGVYNYTITFRIYSLHAS